MKLSLMGLGFTVSSRSLFQCIYGLPGQAQMVSQWVCPVNHHVTCPSWYDEVKINLATQLTVKHHLLFTFLHVSCDLSKQKREKDKESSSPETVVGYSWLPLIHKGRLRVEQQSLPVSAHLPAGYLSFEPLGLGRGVSISCHYYRRSFTDVFDFTVRRS